MGLAHSPEHVVGSSRPAWSLVALAIAATSMMALFPGGADPAAASTTTTLFPMTTFRGLAVDPATGRVFVAGDDVVRVFDAQGTLVTTIPGVYGAGAPFVSGPR